MTHFLFVGERQSPLAAERGWTWQDGRVCAGTLAHALRALGIDQSRYSFVNLWYTPGLGRPDEPPMLEAVREARSAGLEVVALGRRVERELLKAGIPHRMLVHPAARGAIRRRTNYHAHVAAVLRDAEVAS